MRIGEGSYRGCIGFKDISPIVENHTEKKNLENKLETWGS